MTNLDDTLANRARAVAAVLAATDGMTWTVAPYWPDFPDRCATLTPHGARYRLTFRKGRVGVDFGPMQRATGRLSIGVVWPPALNAFRHWPERDDNAFDCSEITVSAARSPDAIAREIARRLLPRVVRYQAELVRRETVHAVAAADGRYVATRIAEAFGVPLVQDRPELRSDSHKPQTDFEISTEWGTGKIWETGATFTLRLTPEQAVAVAHALAALPSTDTE